MTIVVFLLNSFFTLAQSASISGTLYDKAAKEPIAYASVALLKKADSAIVSGKLSTEKGLFLIDKLNEGNYLLQVKALGYKTYTIAVTTKNETLKLDTIFLTQNQETKESVTVVGQKPTTVNKIDKQTFKANQFEAAKGGNAVDVLKNLPSIAVNSTGEISVRGATGFLLLINGKPVITDAQTVLSQLPANSIENIELITAPSAKYDADGKAGIINITTKKGSTDGLALQVNTNVGLPSTTDYNNLENPLRFGADITMGYKKNKWDISTSVNYTRNDANGSRDGDVNTTNTTSNIITRFPSFGERSFDRYNYGFRTSINYSADKRNNVNVGFFASKKYQQRRADITYKNSATNLTTNTLIRQFDYFNSNVQNKEGKFGVGSFDYTHTFTNNSKLSTTAIYESANLYGNTINKNLDVATKSNLYQLVTNPYSNPISGYRLKVDYSTAIGKGKLETGYQYRYDTQKGIIDYNVTPNTNQLDSAKFRGTAASTNRINGLYAQYSAKQNKLQYIAGLRYEYANREVNLSSDVNPHYLKLSNLFPSVNLLYTINNNWNVKAGYSKRVQRNNNFELNPIPEREHSETLEQGDPDLLPQFIDLIETGVTHNYKKGNAFATVYYQDIKNPIQRVNSVYADTILNRVFTNVAKARLFGLELGNTTKFNKWFSLFVGANIYNYKISGGLNILGTTSTVNNSNWVYSINSNATFNLGKQWNLQANINYLSNRPSAQGEDSRFFNPATSLKKSFKGGKYTLGMQWQNISLGALNSNKQRITTWGSNFYTTTNYIYETDILMLNFSINLNKLSSKAKLPTSEIGEKEF